MICLDLNWFFNDHSRMLQLSELVDETDISKISSDHRRIDSPINLF